MKFKILVKSSYGEWWEPYDEDVPDAQKWAEMTVGSFNKTLRSDETLRTLLRVEVEDTSNEKHHRWIKRTGGMSVGFRGRVVDLMFCEKCRITGKRHGFNANVIIDSKFRKKAYQECHTAKIEMNK